MHWLRGQEGPGPGWVKAPSRFEVEIRTVWQEDEMPDEIKADPSYRPFTLSPESQEWVDSMAEVVDGGNAVYGRPKPAVPKIHRSLATPSPAPPLPAQPAPWAAPVFTVPPAAQVQPQPPRPILMPDIAGAPAAPSSSSVRTLPPRVLMPDIGGQTPPTRKSPPAMPEIGGDEKPHDQRSTPPMPEIGDDEELRRPPSKPPRMPEIG